MRITNKLGLPEAIVKAVENDTYDPGDSDITVTTLIDSPYKAWLSSQHGDEVQQDVSDLIFSLFGSAVHNVLEQANVDDLVEERLYIDVDGVKLGGKYDTLALFKKRLSDYKTCSVFVTILGGKDEWVWQLNVLGYLCRMNGYDVEELEIVAIYRDWSKTKASHDKDYPQEQIGRIPIKRWDDALCLNYIKKMVGLHKRVREGEYIPCTDVQRWVKPSKWAVMKDGRKSALRLLDSMGAAYDWAVANKHADWEDEQAFFPNKGISVVERKAEAIRCDNYCSVKPWCKAYHD